MDNVKRDKKIVHAGDTCFRMHEFKEISNMAMEKVQGFFNFAWFLSNIYQIIYNYIQIQSKPHFLHV